MMHASWPRSETCGVAPRTAVALTIIAATIAWMAGGRDLVAQRTAPNPAASGGLWISDTAIDESRRLLMVVDPSNRHAAIYHVDSGGTMTLKSARDISWDLLVDDFNTQDPKPEALKRLIQAGGSAGSGR